MMVHQAQRAATAATMQQQQQQAQQEQMFMHPVMNYPLRAIPQPHSHDVLCGRGTDVCQYIRTSLVQRMRICENGRVEYCVCQGKIGVVLHFLLFSAAASSMILLSFFQIEPGLLAADIDDFDFAASPLPFVFAVLCCSDFSCSCS